MHVIVKIPVAQKELVSVSCLGEVVTSGWVAVATVSAEEFFGDVFLGYL